VGSLGSGIVASSGGVGSLTGKTMNTKQTVTSLVCLVVAVSLSPTFAQGNQPMSTDLQNSIMGRMNRDFDRNVSEPLNGFMAAKTAMALDELARRRQLQDMESQRAFTARQAELQREHERRMEELQRDSVRPTLEDSERAKIEKAAYEKARKDLEDKSKAESLHQARDLAAKAVDQFAIYLTSSAFNPDPVKADGFSWAFEHREFDSNVVSLVQKDFPSAEKRYPVEAPLVKAYLAAARRLIELGHGLRDLDQKDPTDVWVARFCLGREETVKQLPDELRTFEGKRFMTWAEFAATSKTNLSASSQYYTLSTEQLLRFLASDTHAAVRQKLADLEAAGFVRKPTVIQEEQDSK